MKEREGRTTVKKNTLKKALACTGMILLTGCFAACAPRDLQRGYPSIGPAEEEKPVVSTWGPSVITPEAVLRPVPWSAIEAWPQEDPRPALGVFLQSCESLSRRNAWAGVCSAARLSDSQDREAVRQFFEEYFIPHQATTDTGGDRGLITGYYVPDLIGSRIATERFRYPVYGRPDDLVVVDLGDIHPDLSHHGLRGRLQGQRLVPYWTRGQIDSGEADLPAPVLCYVEDPVDLFFLHVQGSGRITLTDGTVMLLNYADQNGHPYVSIGRLLLDRGAMKPHQMSMDNIRDWGQQNPHKVLTLLKENPRYVFFRTLPGDWQMPPGAQGIPLTSGYSLAVDPRTTPLGAPVFLSTTWPNSDRPLHRLMVAQDTGGAIKGPVRADFFWGMGDRAGALAGRMKQEGRMWVLLPRESLPQH